MPELPEVESVRRSLLPHIIGKKIQSVQILKPKLVSGSGTLRQISEAKLKQFESLATGQSFLKIERRAKNLVFFLEDGFLLVHLKMTGQFRFFDTGADTTRHKHIVVRFYLENGILDFIDTRGFGYMLLVNQKDLDIHLNKQNYGDEPLDITFEKARFVTNMQKQGGQIKAVLLNQKVVVGLGNIYADESLFVSGIRPDRKASSVSKKYLGQLHSAIVDVLTKAVEAGGSTISDYYMANGQAGKFVMQHNVYGRGGKPCKKCGRLLKTMKVAGRTTVYCPFDQK